MPGFMLGGRRNVSRSYFQQKHATKTLLAIGNDVVKIFATKIPWLTFVLIEY